MKKITNMPKKIPFLLSLLCLSFGLKAQNNPQWDNTKDKNWSAEFRHVKIPCSIDTARQDAYFYATTKKTPQPLIVSLHTWSGDFRQKDPLTPQILKRDYNYIHPDFRGPNYTPQACGSPLVVSDIDDAIEFAIENGQVDKSQIHIIGASGGGHATLLMYMKTRHNVRSFSAWVPISNLIDWYYESKGRGRKYAQHIELATGSDSLRLNQKQARLRSPFFMKTPVEKRKHSLLRIFCGIHDGYTGSVPISQSLNFYNKIVKDFDYTATESLVPQETILQLISRRTYTGSSPKRLLGSRKIHFAKKFQTIELTVFEGGHEMVQPAALEHIHPKSILCIGDSNGAALHGWANQLRQLYPQDTIVNFSISGNTIGFDNLGRKNRNTLRNINSYLQKASSQSPDYIVLLLGTNDSKAIFDQQTAQVPENLEKLIKKIQEFEFPFAKKPTICIVTPPPYGNDKHLKNKYKGGAKRVKKLVPAFRRIAKKHGCLFVDIHSPLEKNFDNYSPDGVHLSPAGQKKIALMIAEAIEKHQKQ